MALAITVLDAVVNLRCGGTAPSASAFKTQTPRQVPSAAQGEQNARMRLILHQQLGHFPRPIDDFIGTLNRMQTRQRERVDTITCDFGHCPDSGRRSQVNA
jgi:hypothetical protein